MSVIWTTPMWWVNGCIQAALRAEPLHICRAGSQTWCSCLVWGRRKANTEMSGPSVCGRRMLKEPCRVASPLPPQQCTPPPHTFSLFSPLHSPLSSISLFSTLFHWSLFKLISLFPCPLPPSLVPASWLTKDNFQYHNQLETRVNIDQKP